MNDKVRQQPRPAGEYEQSSATRDYRTHHDRGSPAKLSTTLVHALADVMDSDVSAAGEALYESVDPEAVDRLFSSTSDGQPRDPGHLAFAVDGYRVTVYSNGDIVITPPERPRR